MKIRTDFVTNSSSSSFILGFKDKKTIEDEVKSHAPIEYISTIYRDIEKNIISKSEAIKEYKEYAHWEAYFIVSDEKEREFDSYREFREWKAENEKDFDELVKEKEEILINNFKTKIEEQNVFAIVEYDDHINAELEHEIMPRMPFTLYRFNNH